MTDLADFNAQLAERQSAARDIERKTAEAEKLRSNSEDLKVDLQRAEARHAAFAACGNGHVEIPIKQYVPQYHAEIEFQPLLSLLSGRELAVKVAEKIEYLKARIAEDEQEIERLLAPIEPEADGRFTRRKRPPAEKQ